MSSGKDTRPAPALDDDIVQALSGAQAPDAAGDDAAVERVRRRLMRAIAQESVRHHTTITPADGRWHSFLPGIERKVLLESGGVMSYLLKFAPGAVLPAHRHPVDEECMVIEGTLRIGSIVLPPGSFHHVPQNVLDADSTSDDGALIYLRGATPRAEHLL